ncbi:hypothetical protein AB0A60_33435 [Streptomyces sp. NPDC046275]|uniref:hypothetical protein n=1 Tax=Streptomyces sp. NPDC046275 TaxID=3157201 RepID=UPI0033FF60C1
MAVVASSRTKGKGKNSATLARRKAALERAAERMAEQRREAEEAEEQRLRKEAQFDELVADFELAVEDEAAAAAKVEEEVRRVRERGRVQIDAAKAAAARVVLAMGEAGETVAGCGQRLGVGVERVKELRRLGREVLAAQGAALEKGRAGGPEKVAVPRRESAGGPGGEPQLDGGRGPGQADAVSRVAGAAPVAAPPASGAAPVRSAPPAAAPGVPSTAAPAGPSGAPGGEGGMLSGWPESSR